MSEPSAAPHDHVHLRYRTVYVLNAEISNEAITVDHVYAPDGSFACDDCGKPGHDPGNVGLTMTGDDNQFATTLLTAEEALVLANRLQRAASLVLESAEDVPDVEREANRFSVVPDAPDQP